MQESSPDMLNGDNVFWFFCCSFQASFLAAQLHLLLPLFLWCEQGELWRKDKDPFTWKTCSDCTGNLILLNPRRVLVTKVFVFHFFPSSLRNHLHCSLSLYIVLHMLMYAADIYLWKRYQVNYPFIFNFKQGTELGYREVFLLSSGLAVLALACFLANFNMLIGLTVTESMNYAKLIPLLVLLVRIRIT